MREAVLVFVSILLLTSCAQTRPPGRGASRPVPQQSDLATLTLTEKLLALAQEWVDTWNQKDVERMAQLHGDVADTLYGFGDTFDSVETLLQGIRETNFWNVSWKLALVEPRVRILGPDAGLVSFRLVGEESGAGRTKPFSEAFTLVYQNLDGEWKIVHVQDSSRNDDPASPPASSRP